MFKYSLEKIKCVTENDPDLKTLKQYIQDGFPVNRSDCVESVQGYFGFREELAIVNGLIVKGHRVVIPSQLHDEALKLLLVHTWVLLRPRTGQEQVSFGPT